MCTLVLKKQRLGNDETGNSWLAYMVLTCIFPSLSFLHLLQYGGAFVFWPPPLFWTVYVGLCFDNLKLDLHMLFCFWNMQWILNYAVDFGKKWICAFQILVHSFLICKYFSSLFVNREKSRDLQRGLTDPDHCF